MLCEASMAMAYALFHVNQEVICSQITIKTISKVKTFKALSKQGEAAVK